MQPDKLNSFLTLARVRLIFILSSVVLAGLFVFMFVQVKNLVASSDDLNHANFVDNTLRSISSDISYAETSQRGFLLTGDSSHLKRRDVAFSKLPPNLELLDSLFRYDSIQIQNLQILRSALHHKYDIMQDVMDLTHSVRLTNKAKDRIRAASISMEIVKASIDKIGITQKLHLEQKKERYSKLSFFTPLISIVLFAFAFALLLFSYSWLNSILLQSRSLQAALNNEKKLAETILDSSVDLVIVYDTNRRVVYYGKACEKLFGIPKEFAIGKPVEELFPRVTEGKGYQDLQRAIKGETIHNEVYFSPVGQRYYENFMTPIRSENGEVLAVVVVAHDNTDLINITNETKDTNKALEEAQRLANVGSWEWNIISNELIWSPYLRKIYGIEAEEPVSFELFENMLHPDDKKFALDTIQLAFENKKSFEYQHRIINKKGSVRHLLAKGECVTDAAGNVIRMLGTGQDITRQVESEELLRQSQEKFNKLFQFSPFSISLADMNGRYIDINENFVRTFGYSREELIGNSSDEVSLIDPEMRNRIIQELQLTGVIKNVEIEVRKKNGQMLPVLVSIEKINIGEQEYYLNAINDIAERKRAEEKIENANQRLQRMNKELESFAYVSSHDLQEPLRKIQTFSSRILEKEAANLSENGVDQFRRIQKAARRMQTLIEDLLSYSRASTEQKKIAITDLQKVTRDAADELREDITSKGGTIEIGTMCAAPVIPFQFRQLIQNLLSNSIKFAEPSRPLHIQIHSKVEHSNGEFSDHFMVGSRVCHIRISDNGIGFEKEFNEKIFEVFQRLHGRDKYIGTGIGLAIVKKIVENHNGVILAQGNPGVGATFDIYFPLDLTD